MKKQIRSSVFETNSSSSHSISIVTGGAYTNYDTIVPDDDGTIGLEGGQWGWEYENYYDVFTKANYAAVFAAGDKSGKLTAMLVDVLKEHTGAKEIVMLFSTEYDANSDDYSCIDHQSGFDEGGACGEAFLSKESLKDFIFNPRSSFTTDNDNH